MGKFNVYETVKKQKEEEKKSNSFSGVLNQIQIDNLRLIAPEMFERYKSVIEGSSNLLSDYNSRFFDKEGKYVANYRNDSEEAFNKYSSSKEKYDSDITELRNFFDFYGKYLDGQTVSDITDSLNKSSKGLNDMFNTYQTDYDTMSQYKDAKDYNEKVVIPQKQHEEWASADTNALKTEIDNLESSYKAYSELRTEKNSLHNQLVSKYVKQGYTRDEAVKLASENKDIIDYNKKLSAYGDMSNAEQTISNKKQFYNNATRVQEGIVLGGISDPKSEHYDPKFKEYAAKGEAMGDEKEDGWFVSNEDRKNKVAYLRNNPDVLEMYEESAKSANGGSWGTSERILTDQIEYKAAKYMTDEEFQIFNAYMGKDDEESAYKYAQSIEGILNARQGGALAEEQDNLFKKIVFGANAGLDNWEQGIISLFNAEGEYDAPTGIQYASGAIRESMADEYGIVGQGAYDLFNTTANMLPSILVSTMTGNIAGGLGAGVKTAQTIGKLAGAATLGSSAAGNGYQEMLNLGYDKSQARAYGTLVGLSEAGLEYALGGISSLGGKFSGGITNKIVTKLISNTDKAIYKIAIGAGGKLLGSMVSEFGEEYLQEVLDPVFKNITLKTDEDIKLFSAEALYSGILGALSAGLLEGGSSISSEVATYKAGKDVKNTGQLSNLKKFGTSFSADTVAYKIASQVNENTDAYTIGQLLHEVGADSLSEANMADISKSLERKGIAPGQAQTIAKWLNSAVMGENFSPLQKLALKNPDITQTFKDVIINENSTVNQRVQGYMDILQNIANEKANINASKAKAKADKKADKESKVAEETKSTSFIPYSSEEIDKRLASGEVVVDSEGKPITDTKKAIEGKFEVNLDGKTVNIKSGEEVNVSEIASIDNGKMKLKLDNEEIVDAEDISFGTESDNLIYSTVLDMGVNAAVANSLVKNYNPSDKLSAKQYALGIKEAYKYGSYGMPITEISKKGFAADLSEAQRTHAYNLGKADTAAKVVKAQEEVKNGATGKAGIEGKVHFKGDTLALKEVQRESLKRMGVLSEVLGVDFHVFESYVVNGKRVFKDTDGKIKKAPNGYYKNGKIYIDLNAGIKGDGIMIYTVSHELGHFIKEWSPAKFKILADFLMEQYGKKGHNVNDLVQAQIDKAKRNGRTIDYDTAYEEMVCDSLELMLSDDAVYEKILELKSKDASIVKKIGEFFAKIIDSFKKMMQQYPPETPEGKLVSEMKDAFTELQSLFAEALVDASDNYQANDGQKNTTSEGDVKFMARDDGSTDFNPNGKSLKEQLEEALDTSKSFERRYVYIGEFTQEFTDKLKKHIDIKKLPIVMNYRDAYLSMESKENGKYQGQGINYHNLGIDGLESALLSFESPECVILSKNENKIEFVLEGRDYKNRQVFSIVEVNTSAQHNRKNLPAHVVSSVYGKGNLKNYLANAKNEQRIIYNKNEEQSQVMPQVQYERDINEYSSKGSIPQTSKKSQEKQSGRENTIGERNLEDFADAKDTDGNTLFQYRAMESDEDIYRGMLKTAKIMNDSEIDSLFDTIDRAMDIIKDNLEILDYAWDTDIDDRAFNPVKKNTDKLYQVSVDFSTLCRKRLLQQSIQAYLQDALNRPLTKAEGIAIRDALMTIQEEGKKIEIACALCYVESARMKSPAQIKRFVDDRETVIKNHFAGKSNEVKTQLKEAEVKARKRLGVDDTPLTKLPSKMQKEIRAAKKDVISSYVPSAKEQELIEIAKGMSVNDFVTPKGLENLIKKYPDLFDAYASYIVNATHSKGIESDTWWRAGDSKNIGDTLIANMNAENGLRSQSWSDFQVIHLLDYIAATIELSTRNAKMQAYTKVPDFVELMGNTGEMINLSLIPTRNFNGTLEFDSVEGMAFEESLRLRDKYHATTGTIAIGIGNKQIQMLLDSLEIDYVIPYHRSGMAKAVRKAMHIPTWDEYENYQSEKNLSRDDAKRQAKKYGVELLAETDSNYQKHPNFSEWFDIKEARQIAKMENANPSDKAMQKKYGVMYGGYMAMQNAANNYLKLCAERGIAPKFSHENANFATEDNYWKLLIDRKMIDNVTGEVIEQQAVKPIFDQGEVLRILNDELERYPGVKADQDYATRKVAENFLSGNIKGGMSAEAIAKAMKKPVDNVAKVNILASVEDSKLSDRDSDYMDAVNRGDMKTAQKMVDEAAKKAGYDVKAYHGTPNSDFTQFDYEKIGSNTDSGIFGRGFYFTTHKDTADVYATESGTTMPVYLQSNNPWWAVAFRDVQEVADKLGMEKSALTTRGYGGKGKIVTPSMSQAGQFSAHLQEHGYDSVVVQHGKNNYEIVVFDSNQIKSADPVTYDDKGNVIPLSQRFNMENEDIRYSERDSKTTDDIEKINKQLAKENVKLIEDVKYLKELVKLQGKETHGKMLKKSTVELVAKRLMAYQSAKGNVSELTSLLTDVYSYIAQGEDVSWEGIQEKSQAAVDWLMENEYHKPVRDEYATQILNHLRTSRISLDDLQKGEVAHKYGSYENFRKKNMGRVIFANDGISLDTAWQELAEMYPTYFDKDTRSNDQPIILMEIIDGLQNTYEADDYHYFSEEMIAQDLMTKVYEGYWDVSALHTVADAKQKEINLLKAKHIERMDALRQSHEESEAKLRQEHRERISQLRTQYREREEKKIQQVAQYYQKSRKEAVDRVKETREKRDAITKLQKLVLDTAKWVSYPAKNDVKCPDIIRAPYAEFLSSIDLTSKRVLNGGEPTKNDLRVASAMDSLAKAIEKKLGTQSPETETNVVLDTGYLDLPAHFVEKLKELAEDLKKRMETDGHIVNSMTSEEIKALTKFIKTLNHSIKEMSTLYANMRFARVEQLGNDSMVFLKGLGEYKNSNSIVDFVTWDNALPYYTFKRFGVAGESVFEELMDAQDKLAYLAKEIFKFKDKTWSNKEASEWSKDTHTIELPSGRELTLTSADAMSIYCLARREQGRQHLLGGGVRVLGIEKNGKKANDSRSLLNLKDIEAIYSSLTERQKQVAEAIQEFMSTTCAEWGNEISMKRFLTKEFTEKFYFPIESNDENLDTKDPKAQQSDLYRLLNISATKPLTKGANNEVIIRNIFDVFTSHSSDMAKLNAYGMALLDYMKWINYREKTVNDDGQISVSGVRKSMEKAYGPEANKYVIGLIKDINGRYSDNGDNQFLMKMLRGAKTAMVGANLRVAALQITAYPRAAMVLSTKSLVLGLTKLPQIKKAKKYCGIALWKSFGFYDTNISRSIEDQLKGTTNIRQKLIELSLKGAEWGDAITWGCLWNACEYEVAKTKQYKVGSEEFNQAVGKKLREVVYATQVVDSTLTRSQMMRSKSGLTQTASAFMSEPTLSANILMDAAFQFNLEKRRTGSAKLAWKKTGKFIGKAVAVYSIGQIFVALAEALLDAYRDDDDEEFKDKFGEAFAKNAISDLNPFNKIPIIADVSDLFMSWFGIGFSSSNSLYLQAIDEASNAFDIWSKVINGEDGKTVYAGIYSTTKLLSYITGVSASGLMREVVTLWNNTAGAVDPYLKIRTYESSATDKGIAEYNFDKGDTTSVKTTVSKMIEDKVKSGKTEKEAKSAVRSSFTSTYKAEYMDAVEAKDYDEMNRIRKFLYATGLYGTLTELDETLRKWRTGK